MGTGRRDVICGGGGADLIRGRSGGDVLRGGPGDDTLSGGAGDDLLDGGSGLDGCTGGPGSNELLDTCDVNAPPSIQDLTVSPVEINTSDGGARVEFGTRIYDDWSAIFRVTLWVGDPNPDRGARYLSLHPTIEPDHGTWVGGLTYPRYSHAGTYTIQRVELEDGSGNKRVYRTSELDEAGWQTTFQQTGSVVDEEAPALTSFDVAPRVVDTSGGDRAVTFTVGATDAQSGVDQVEVGLRRSNGDVAASGQNIALHQGDIREGVWQGVVTLPRYAPPDTYEVDTVHLTDGVGNVTSYGADWLASEGYPTTVQQVGPGDTEAPTLAGFEITPRTIDTAAAGQTVDFEFHVTDDLSGLIDLHELDRVDVDLRGPDGSYYSPYYRTQHVSGSPTDSLWRTSIVIPAGSPVGEYEVVVVGISDRVANQGIYRTADLEAAGFPARIYNGTASP